MSGLVERALARLEAGPAHSSDLARAILSLNGPPEMLSAAVRTLLGGDHRFHSSADGMWSLEQVRRSPALADLRFAVTDVEATGGGFGTGHRIIDIGIAQVERGSVGELWQTLVNAGRWIPAGVQYLTGIDESMLRGAPFFDEVAQDVQDRI